MLANPAFFLSFEQYSFHLLRIITIMSTQNWLVTGASRGLGQGLIASILQRENVLAIAAVRNPTASITKKLASLPSAEGSRVIVVKIDAESDSNPRAAIETPQKDHDVRHLDVVISNAGVAAPMGRTDIALTEDFRRDFQVNALATLLLFQASWPLLQKSSSTPKFIGISTCLATIGNMADYPWPCVAYGTSKAAQNFIVKKIHHEHESLVAFVVHPG